MAAVTLYRFRLDLSDVDRGVYEDLDFRAALHPSENELFLVTRVLAYALNCGDGLEFSPGGLSDPDAPAMSRMNSNGGIGLWVDIGNPTSKRLHKASKASDLVRIYTYKNPANLKMETAGENIHKREAIEVYAIDPKFLEKLAALLQKDNRWSVIYTDGELVVNVGDASFMTTIAQHRLI